MRKLSRGQWGGIAAAVVVGAVVIGHRRDPVDAQACLAFRDAAREIEEAKPVADEVCEKGVSYVPELPPDPPDSSPGCRWNDYFGQPSALRRDQVAAPERPIPYFAPRAGALPGDGPATVAGVALPSGSRCPHYWATDAPVPDAPALASRLAEAFPQTGLWPVLFTGFDDPDAMSDPTRDPRDVDTLDPEAVLRKATYGAPFDGLAASSGAKRPDPFGAFVRMEAGEPAADPLLLLVPVNRPADAVALLGLIQSEITDDLGLTAVVRSWEERFGAVVTAIETGSLGLAIGDPPANALQSRALARELRAFAPEDGLHEEREVARAIEGDGQIEDLSREFWWFGWPD